MASRLTARQRRRLRNRIRQDMLRPLEPAQQYLYTHLRVEPLSNDPQ